MLATIFNVIGGSLVDSLLKNVTGIFKAYFEKQITEAQLREQLLSNLLTAVKEVEVAHADSLSKTYASFMQTLAQSKLMQVMWASVVGTQLFVLTWHQFGIPLLCYHVGKMACYPSSGTTVEWAYLLLAACLGMGPVILRSGPGAGDLASRFTNLIKTK